MNVMSTVSRLSLILFVCLGVFQAGVAADSFESPSRTGAGPAVEFGEDDLPPTEFMALEAPARRADRADGLSPELLALRQRVRRCLKYYFDRPENVAGRSPWGIMHSFLSFGLSSRVIRGDRHLNAIGYLCSNGAGRGQRLFYTEGGQLRTRLGPGFQGHEGQFLAMLAQCRVRIDYPMRVGQRSYTVEDLVDYEMQTCRQESELTFKLIGLVHYLSTDAQWKNDQGDTWSIERLIQEELAQSVTDAACGGTHRMMGFSYAVDQRRRRGGPMTGQWRRAEQYVEDYILYTFRLQNPDGSFSTNWFKGRGDLEDREVRLQTTGHVLEWLIFSLPESKLLDPRIVRSVDYLCELLWSHRGHRWEVGPKGHALRALSLYDQRVFAARPGQAGPENDPAAGVHADR